MKKRKTFLPVFLMHAKKLGVKVTHIKNTPIYNLKYGRKEVNLVRGTLKNTEISTTAIVACENKSIAKNILNNNNISTPKWREFYKDSSLKDIKKYSRQLKMPVVIKPHNGIHGTDISVGVKTISEIVKIIKKLQKKYKCIIVEEMFNGDEIRVLATRKKVIAATWRRPASVVGDGKHTVGQLVKIKNKDRVFIIKPLVVNKNVLKENGLKLGGIPKKGERVFVQKVSNLAQGEDSIDVTDKIHPSLKKIAVKTIRALPDVKYAGLDIMLNDYTKKQTKNSYTVIEINAFPMISMHYKPYKGKPRNIVIDILQIFFPKLKV